MSVNAIQILTIHVKPFSLTSGPSICLFNNFYCLFFHSCIHFVYSTHDHCSSFLLSCYLPSLQGLSPHAWLFFSFGWFVWRSTEFQDHLYGSGESSLWVLAGSFVSTLLKRWLSVPHSLSSQSGGRTLWATPHPWLTVSRSPVGSRTCDLFSAFAVSCPEDSNYCPSPLLRLLTSLEP